MMIATYGLILFSLKYFTAFIVTIPLIIYVDSFIFTRIFKSLENTNDERAREAEKEKAEKQNLLNNIKLLKTLLTTLLLLQ